MRVGFAGLGRMGLPMATNLLRAGHELTVYNRTPERARPLVEQGAHQAAFPSELGENEVVVTMLADPAAVEAVLAGPDGVLSGARPGLVVIDMSTIGPALARALAARCAARGVHWLDAPVAGSVKPAEEGTLIAMVGGDSEVLAAVRPVLGAMCREVFHLGPAGAGAAMKLVFNLFLAVSTAGLAEALALGEAAALERGRMLEVIAPTVLGSRFVALKGGQMAARSYRPAAFTLDLLHKDLGLIAALAEEARALIPAAALTHTLVNAARYRGRGDEDYAALVELFRELGGA